MELLLQVGTPPWHGFARKASAWQARPPCRLQALLQPGPPTPSTHPDPLCLQNNKIRAATHNIMAYRIEQAERGTFLQVWTASGHLGGPG